MHAGAGKADIEHAGDVFHGHRAVGLPAIPGFHFHQGLKPGCAARAVAHHLDIQASHHRLRGDLRGDFVRTQRTGRGVGGNVNAHGHDVPTSLSNRSGVTRACTSSPMRTDGEQEQLPRQ